MRGRGRGCGECCGVTVALWLAVAAGPAADSSMAGAFNWNEPALTVLTDDCCETVEGERRRPGDCAGKRDDGVCAAEARACEGSSAS